MGGALCRPAARTGPKSRKGVGSVRLGDYSVAQPVTQIGGSNRSHCKVYLGTMAPDGHTKVAMKLEPLDSDTVGRLAQETAVYEASRAEERRGNQFCPRLLGAGDTAGYRVVVLELMGPDLQDVYGVVNADLPRMQHQFSLETVCVVAIEGLRVLQALHRIGYIHNDVSPHNFVMPIDIFERRMSLVGFGNAKKFLDPKTHRHIPRSQVPGGHSALDAPFASTSLLKGKLTSRRDDLESLGYVLVYLLAGTLPWMSPPPDTQGTLSPAAHAAQLEQNRRRRLATTHQALCASLADPGFQAYFDYVTHLDYDEAPDYRLLSDLFRQILVKHGTHESRVVTDWMKVSPQYKAFKAKESALAARQEQERKQKQEQRLLRSNSMAIIQTHTGIPHSLTRRSSSQYISLRRTGSQRNVNALAAPATKGQTSRARSHENMGPGTNTETPAIGVALLPDIPSPHRRVQSSGSGIAPRNRSEDSVISEEAHSVATEVSDFDPAKMFEPAKVSPSTEKNNSPLASN